MALLTNAIKLASGASTTLAHNTRLTFSRCYAKKIVGKIGAQASQKSRMEVETDPERLLSHCCGANINVDGTDPELKPDSEYPEWLWTLSVDRRPPDLSELDPDSPYYWRRVSKIVKLRQMKFRKRMDKLGDIQSPLTDKN